MFGVNRLPSANDPVGPLPSDNDEGGLRAPPGLKGWRKAWWWFDFIILVKLARLRFIGILAVIGVIITQWDTLNAYYEKWTRPSGAVAAAASGIEYFCPMHPSIIRDAHMPLSAAPPDSETFPSVPDQQTISTPIAPSITPRPSVESETKGATIPTLKMKR